MVSNNILLIIIIIVVIIMILNTKSLLVERLTGKYRPLENKMKPRRRVAPKSSQNKWRAPCWQPHGPD